MTAPHGYTIIKDEPLLSKANSTAVRTQFQRLHDVVLSATECRTGNGTHTTDSARGDFKEGVDLDFYPVKEGTNKAQIKSGLLTLRASEVTPKRVDAIWKDANGG